MHPKEAEGMANSVDHDQTAPLMVRKSTIFNTTRFSDFGVNRSVHSGSAQFAQTCLSENLGTLRYILSASFRAYSMIKLIISFTIQILGVDN